MTTTRDAGQGDEGPLAHAARVASERSYLDGLSNARQQAWARASGARPERTPKRLLVSLSHSIEKAVLGGPIEYPTVVVALFQQLRFFDREREVYERMAAAGAIVVVGFVEGSDHEPPEGVHVVPLRPDEPLADEWSVVAVGPHAGAFLVATDQHAFDPAERDHEASREFVGRWGYSRAQAGTELARLRFSLGDRLDVVLRATIDDLLAEHMPSGGDPAASAGTPGETWATTSLGHMMDGMITARAGTRELREQLADAQRAATARAAATTDPHSGVSNPDFLHRWSTPTGANPLPIGLALFDVAELDGDAMRGDNRASYFAAHQVAAALTQPLGPVDAVVRMSAREFLIVVPGASPRHLAGLCDRIGEQLELASHGYPDISLRARVASTVTSRRPLPVSDLHASLSRLDDGGSGPVEAGDVPGGDLVVVSSTALHASAPGATGDRGPGDAAAGEPARPSLAGPGPDGSGLSDGSTTADGARGTSPGRPAPNGRPAPAEANGSATSAGSGPSNGSAPAGSRAAAPADPGQGPAVPAPGRPWAEDVSPFGHTGSQDPSGPGTANPVPSVRPGGHRAAPEPGDTGGSAHELPHRTAQEALHRLVYGDGADRDPRSRMDVFADLSDPPNGHGPHL